MMGQSIGRNFAVLSVGQLASRFLTFLASIHLAKALGADGLGQLLILTSVLAYAASLVDFGIQKLGPVKVGRADEPLNELVSNVVILRTLLAAPILLILLVVTLISPLSISQKMMAAMYALSIIANVFDLSWVFIGTGWVLPSVVCNIVSQTLYAAGVFWFIKDSHQIGIVPAVFLASNLVLVAAQLCFYTGKYRPKFKRPDFRQVQRLAIAALPLMGSSVVGLILVNFEIIVTGACLNASASGLFGAASKITAMLIMLVGSYFTVLAPHLASAYRIGSGSLEQLLKISLKLTTAVAIGVVSGGLVLSPSIIQMLYGPAFQPATAAFQVLLFSFGLLAISRNYRTCLIAAGHQTVDLKVVSISAVVTVITSPLLVKMYGIFGAACAVVLAELIMLFGFAIAMRRLNLSLPFLQYIWKPLLSAFVMSSCLIIWPNLPTIFRIAEGATIYVIALLLLRVTSSAEVIAFLRGSISTEVKDLKVHQSSYKSLEPAAPVRS